MKMYKYICYVHNFGLGYLVSSTYIVHTHTNTKYTLDYKQYIVHKLTSSHTLCTIYCLLSSVFNHFSFYL